MATNPPALDLSQGLTLDLCRTELGRWLAASAAIAENQSYRIGDYEYTRADLGKVLEMIRLWQGNMSIAMSGTGGGRRSRVIRRVC